MFATVRHFHPSLIFAGKTGAYQSEAPYAIPSICRLPAMTLNIRLGWKWLTVANTLAFYDTAIITSVKSFKV